VTAGGEVTIDAFGFQPGRSLGGKYEVVSALGGGWEGEVYLVRERATGIERTAKAFFPQRNRGDRTAKLHAKKLHELRECPIVIQYHGRDVFRFRGVPITLLVSEYIRGELLSHLLARRPGGRLEPFQALHLLHALASGMDCVHQAGQYHGDLHSDNILVRRAGLGFDLKLIDPFHWQAPKKESIQYDVVEMVRIFHEALGGRKHYAAHPPEVKAICCGLKRTLILRKFRTAGQLKTYLETMEWS
jgi:tRNA A-37 threonylcarbamoyl transferase component Bud32